MTETHPPNLIHTQAAEWSTGNSAELTYRYKNLDGQHIGAGIEELAIGGTWSYHHYLVNQSDELCTYLVYGERKEDDVVVYPDARVMMIKSLGRRQFTYRPLIADDSK